MRPSLASWVSDADALRYIGQLGVREVPLRLAYQTTRKDDLYLALVGELFQQMRDDDNRSEDWARLGNALAQYAAADKEAELRSIGVKLEDAALFAAAAFYFGGFPASAYLAIRTRDCVADNHAAQACFDLLARPTKIKSPLMLKLLSALRRGDLDAIALAEAGVHGEAQAALHIGPDQWIPTRLLQKLIGRFRITNLRSVLPDGPSGFWTPLILSFLNREPPTWDFFPSQIKAIQSGLLERTDTFSLQMPTGAGKTALCEILLYRHLKRNVDDAAVMLVPYRSLASELRSSLVKRLNGMGISARCAYGGTVPTGDEVRAFDDTRALIATPETLSGILSANPAFAKRISLAICDEGHLLDAPSRGVGLELLLSRMKVREVGAPRFVFLSAIIPNIEEINLWLGGTQDSVVLSDYRPAIAEFSVLRPSGRGVSARLDLEMHPHEAPPVCFRIECFLQRDDFQWTNSATGQRNTYPFTSLKTRAIAAARKTLPMGATVVFAANKRGDQGAIGLAEELLKQISQPLRLPDPISFANIETIGVTAEYLELEYGAEWVGTRAFRAGAVLHHGDIPQETREVVEAALRQRNVQFGICTNTLAEGVNLPIRTLVLYSVQRVGEGGARENLLTRDIKNLVGRAGRAGATTKGLVVCANERQWPLVEAVARQAAGEPVAGALRSLIVNVRRQLAAKKIGLTNELLEGSPNVHSLIDGIDATLLDLAATEIGDDDLLRLATQLAEQTFAFQQTDAESKKLLQDVFSLRAQRVTGIRSTGRLEWVRETGTRARMLDLVETGLVPLRQRWDDITDPINPGLVNIMLEWAWTQEDLQQEVREAYRLNAASNIDSVRESFFEAIRLWLAGRTFFELATGGHLPINDMLGLHSQVITFTLQTIVEQAVALLERLLRSQGQTLAPAVTHLPEHLRFGVPTTAGLILASGGIRHRRAYVALGAANELLNLSVNDKNGVFHAARVLLEQDTARWETQLGRLVLERTREDLSK